jgi:outer membrane lipoprotein-sorting protein
MKLYWPALLCAYLMIATGSGIAATPVPSTSDLVKLVKSYRAKVSDIDVRWTYIHETLGSDPTARKSDPIPKIVDHIRQRGPLYVEDSLSWRTGLEEPLHFVIAYDGEKQVIYDVDHRIAHITPADINRARLANWMYQALKWPQQPERSPYGDLVRLLESDRMTILPEKETVYGVETVVLDHDGWEKIWLDIQHGGIIRKSEGRQSAGGPLSRRFEIPEIHDVNGVFLPARIVRTDFASAKNPKEWWNTPVSRYTITIPKETFKINSGFTKKDFQLELPPGTRVTDGATRTQYTVGSPPGR